MLKCVFAGELHAWALRDAAIHLRQAILDYELFVLVSSCNRDFPVAITNFKPESRVTSTLRSWYDCRDALDSHQWSPSICKVISYVRELDEGLALVSPL